MSAVDPRTNAHLFGRRGIAAAFGPSPDNLARRRAKAAERAANPRRTRRQRLADLRAEVPGATKADLRAADRAKRRAARVVSTQAA